MGLHVGQVEVKVMLLGREPVMVSIKSVVISSSS
jgi:hypothetical protein